jgi:hypothetical protein
MTDHVDAVNDDSDGDGRPDSTIAVHDRYTEGTRHIPSP